MNTCLNAQLSPITAEWLSKELQQSQGKTCFLVDIRPSAQHCCRHIKQSENINFSNILLRRLIKGVVSLDAHISSTEVLAKISQRDPRNTKLILYDGCSHEGSVRSEITKHAEVLYKTNLTDSAHLIVYYLEGGFSAFSEQYPDLCESSPIQSVHSPIGISVSASLPISFARPAARQQLRAQTPLEDESSRFGPPVEILPFLVLGCARDSSNLTVLRQLGVTAVLNVSHNCASHFEELFEYKTIPVQDSHHADLLSQLDTAFEFINSIKAKGGRVFVHCHAGISRSATVCIAYIMKHMDMCLSKSYDFVKQKRPCISPNLHFMGQLLEFERKMQKITDDIKSPICDCTTPMDVDSIPVSVSTTAVTTQTLPKTGNREIGCLRLTFNISPITGKSSPRPLNRSLHSASAPSSFDLPAKTETITTTPIKASVQTYNHRHMGQFYSSTDGMLYQIKTSRTQTSSLPATPVNDLMESCLPASCRTQLNYESALGSTKTLDSSIQLSPCRVVACDGSKFV